MENANSAHVKVNELWLVFGSSIFHFFCNIVILFFMMKMMYFFLKLTNNSIAELY